jgi:hypothetical protein
MTSLTDRYVAATLRAVPPKNRAEIERELRSSIADAGESQTETQVLAALGDPRLLAAEYSDRTGYLIGPALFTDYWRVLSVTLATAVPVLFVIVAISQFANSATFLGALGESVSVAGLVAMHVAVWTTVVFAAIERRRGTTRKRTAVWDPASLTALPQQRIDLAAVIGGTAVATAVAAALILLHTVGPVRDAMGHVVGPIEPHLWESGVLMLSIFFAAAAIALDVAAYYVGRGRAYAFANLVLSALFVACTVAVAWGGRLLNADFFAAIGWPAGAGANGIVTWVVMGAILLLSVSNVSIAFSKSRGLPVGVTSP